MVINLNWIVAFLGCVTLIAFWLWQRASGMSGFLWMLIGNLLIIGALMYVQDASLLTSPGGIAILVSAGLALLLLGFGKLAYVRRHYGPRYQAPDEMSGRCSACAKPTRLKHYEQGWLCPMCATRRSAQAA